MSDAGVSPLYSSIIAERFRRPRFRGTLASPSASAEGFNPLCGDRIRFDVRIYEQRIEAVCYHGDACAICLASADVLAECVEGRPCADVHAVSVDQLRDRLAANITPSRLACVNLPLTTLVDAIVLAEATSSGKA